MAAKLKLKDQKNSPPVRTYGYLNGEDQVTRNRVVNTSRITAQMQFHHKIGNVPVGRLFVGGGKNTPPPAKKFFCLFRELTDAKRILEIYESEDETISITLISDETDSVIRLVQHPASNLDVPPERRCVIYDIRGDQTRQRNAATFDELLRENRDYLNTEWLPLMKGLGIEVEITGSQNE